MTSTRPTALALALILVPGTVAAKGQSPDDAAAKRAELAEARPTDPRAAIEQLTDSAQELGDPELFLLAAQLAYAEADQARDLELAQLCGARAAVAQDIGLHLADKQNYSATDWKPVTRERAAELAEEAEALVASAAQLADTIEAERAAAEAERARLAAAQANEDEGRTKRELKPGTGWIAGGSAALVLGVAGVGMLGVGVARGQARQRDAEKLVLPDELDQLAEYDQQGKKANTIAIVGGVMAGIGIGAGVALIIIGVKKRKAAASGDTAGMGRNQVLVGGWIQRETGGLAVQGRF